jgi:hypothetical protein
VTVRRKTVETPWQQRSSRVVASVIRPGGGLLAVTFMHAVSASVCLALGHTLLWLAGRAAAPPPPPPPAAPLPADATCWPAHGL